MSEENNEGKIEERGGFTPQEADKLNLGKKPRFVRIRKLIKSKLFWVLAVIIFIAAVFTARAMFGKKAEEYATTKVIRGDVVQTVSATGSIKAASEINLNFKISGRITKLNSKVGDEVKAGQILAQIEGRDLAVNVSKAAASLAASQADLARLLAGATLEDVATLEIKVSQSETDLKSAEQDLENIKLTYSQDLENKKLSALSSVNTALTKADIALQTMNDTLNFKNDSNKLVVSDVSKKQKANDDYDLAKEEVLSAKNFYSQASSEATDGNIVELLNKSLKALDIVSEALDSMADALDYTLVTNNLSQTDLDTLKSSINTQRTTIDSSYDSVQTADQNFKDAQVTYQTKVDDAQQTVETAEKALTKAKADLAFKVASPRQEDILYYQAKVRQAEADLAYAQSKYEETILRAPVDGVIVQKNKYLGEQADATKAVYTMLSDGNYEIEVDIPESDIIKIKLNDNATITLDALTDDDKFSGVIAEIDPAQTEIQDVVYYRVTVTFKAEQPENVLDLMPIIKPGMTANVTVETDKREGVIIAPQRAIRELNGTKTVEVLVDGKPQERDVVVGLRGDDGLAEIISGLLEGEDVITFTKKN